MGMLNNTYTLDNLYRRRPVVDVVRRWAASADAARTLDPASMTLFAQIAQQLWKYIDQVRQADIAQPVDEQVLLGRVEAWLRGAYVVATRYSSQSDGQYRLYLTEEARDALVTMAAYDPLSGAPGFDLDLMALRLALGGSIR
jgi:hypothetical protein